MLGRALSNRNLHLYLNADRDSDPEALAVHGLTTEFLADKPRFDQIADEFLAFVQGAELIIHNASFDVRFDAELARVGKAAGERLYDYRLAAVCAHAASW